MDDARPHDDPEVAERVRAMVRRCPSGRIVTRDPDGTADEPAYPPSVAIVTDGPLWVRGGVPVVAADGDGLRGSEPTDALPVRRVGATSRSATDRTRWSGSVSPEASIRVVRGGPMLVDGAPLGRLAHDGDRWTLRADRDRRRVRALPMRAIGGDAVLRSRGAVRMLRGGRRRRARPGPFRWDVPDPDGPPALALKPDGPVRVAGPVAITFDDAPQGGRDRWSLCRCGASRCQPVCDSSHKVVGYRG